MISAQADGGSQPLIGKCWRHADIDHCHIGGIGSYCLLQAGGIADGPDHGESPVCEKLDQPVP